jgi:intracellular sulfur oxidation DsrE/DsrF family protein
LTKICYSVNIKTAFQTEPGICADIALCLEHSPDVWRLTILKEADMTIPDSDTVIIVTRNGMGDADPELQLKLATTYFKLLDENNIHPAAICFYTNGVRLVVDDSPVLTSLKSLESKGVRLILCSTCLSYFNLTEKVQVGIVGGMTDIIEAQRQADKVISL